MTGATILDPRANTAAQIARSLMPTPQDGTQPNVRMVIDLARNRFDLELTKAEAQAAIAEVMSR